MLDTTLQSTSPVRAWNPVARAESPFAVPKSPLRADGARAGGRDAPRILAGDSFEPSPLYSATVGAGLAAQPSAAQAPGLGLAGGQGLGKSDAEGGSAFDMEEEGGGVSSDAAEGSSEENGGKAKRADGETDAKGEPLSDQEQAELDKLQSRDREVRQHEQAHKSVGGSYAGAISYEYQQGPDGKRYAVGGEVSIDVSPEKDAAATAAKMRQVRAAALAPAQPSPQDHSVATEAARLESQARIEMNRERTEEKDGGEGTGTGEKGEAGAASGDNADASSASPVPASVSAPASAAISTGAEAKASLVPPSTGAAGSAAGSFAKLSSPYGSAAIPARHGRRAAYAPLDVFA